jgi:hypothetical protein
MYDFNRDAQLQATVNASCWYKEICTLSDVMEITDSQPWQDSFQHSCSVEVPNAIAR